jgi:excisionase family DNA binding protein
VFEDGKKIELPPQVLHALQFVLHHMARGDAISLVPMSKMLTTNQAAEILNVSRPFLVKLLNEGAIKFTMVGTHHRLLMSDVLQYKQRRDRQMLDKLDELANEAQAAGNYFDE